MKALSVRPPYAYFIIHGVPVMEKVYDTDTRYHLENSGKVVLKDVENRSWPVPKGTTYPFRVYIHVSRREAPIEGVLELFHKIGLSFMAAMMGYSRRLPRGAIIGEVDIIGCVTDSKSPWAMPGMHHWMLINAELYEKPIPYKGQQRLFEVKL